MTTTSAIDTFCFIFPCIVLLFLLFKDRPRPARPLPGVLLCICLYLVYTFFGSYLYFTNAKTSVAAQSLISILGIAGAILFFTLLVKYNLWQNIFVVITVKSYGENLCLLTSYLYFLFTGTIYPQNSPGASTIHAALTAVTFPFMCLFFKKILRPALDYSTGLRFWKLLWTIPVMNNIIYSLIISPSAVDNLPELQQFYLIVPPLWMLLTFATHFLILMIIVTVNENAELKNSLYSSEILASTQQRQNKLLQMHIENTKRQRHDVRHHLLAIDGLAKAGDAEGIENYLKTLGRLSQEYAVEEYCENQAVNALISYYKERAEENGTSFSLSVQLPQEMPYSDTDLCIVLGNLLENAVEACGRMNTGERFISLKISQTTSTTLVILIENSYEGCLKTAPDGSFLSSKAQNRHGIGIPSVLDTARKYDGIHRFQCENQVFKVSLLLNAQPET